MHLPGSTYSKISSLFCGRFRIASVGKYRGNADCVAFIFAFDAEMVAGHVHLLWFWTGFYAVKRNENRPDGMPGWLKNPVEGVKGKRPIAY
jgi:hypothetical protein